MKIQNMKLLDLQTGKYLELDKDFWFGGNVIILFENLKRSANTYSLLDEVNACARFIKQPHTNPIVKEICKKVGAICYGGRYVLARNTMCEYNIMYKITYADYISAEIPRNFEHNQHIYSNVIKIEPKYFSDKFICEEKDYLETIKRLHKIKDDTRIEILQVQYCGEVDILKEYSKQLRNELNKFDELNELLK